MPKFLWRHRREIAAGIIIFLPLALYLLSGARVRQANVGDEVVLAVAAPVQMGVTSAVNFVGDLLNGYVLLRNAHVNSQQCTTQLVRSQAELNAALDAKQENDRLLSLLQMKANGFEESVAARVVGVNDSMVVNTLRLNRGTRDGISVGMAVVTPLGVVGKIVRVAAHSADVLLLTDPASHIGGIVERTRVRGSVVGSGSLSNLKLQIVRRDEDVREGDTLLTSGTDGVYPKGLPVGRVSLVSKVAGGMFMSAQVEPAIDQRKIEEVLIVPPTRASDVRPDGGT